MKLDVIFGIALVALFSFILGSLGGAVGAVWFFLKALKVNRLEFKEDGSIGPILTFPYVPLWEADIKRYRKDPPDGW